MPNFKCQIKSKNLNVKIWHWPFDIDLKFDIWHLKLLGRQISQQGSTLIYTVIVIFIFSMVMLAVLSYATIQLRVVRSTVSREQAFQVAEAGVNYYQWRLAHFQTDYYDGNATSTSPGPYLHDYIDQDTSEKIGEYSLEITPPAVGSTIVTIKSTGYTIANPKIKRTLTVRYGVPSLAKYAFLSNSDAWIGNTESVSGQFHTNGGLRFDGTGNALISSAKSTYDCGPTFGCSPTTTKAGIWGSAPISTQAYWQFPTPNIDFSSITSDLANIKSNAQINGLYLAPSSALGYSLVFLSNGTFRVYKVTSLRSHASGMDVNGVWHPEDLDYNARTEQTGACNPYPCAMPLNGLIYVEDRTWVEGVVNGKVLVATAKLPYNPATAPSLIIPNSLTYLAKNGNHVLGLIGQKDVLLSYYAPNTLEVNAAIIAQNGSAQRYYFAGNTKTSFTLYGSLSSFGTWTWSWTSGASCTSGYCNTSTSYDGNLLFGPPPSFPLSTDGYQQITWNSD